MLSCARNLTGFYKPSARVGPDEEPAVVSTGDDEKDELLRELAFPMWVVPVSTMRELAKTGKPLPKHEDLAAQSKLLKWKPGMKTLFFSHTWLGNSHPDPMGPKTALIAALLDGIANGKTQIMGYWMAFIIFNERGISAKRLSRDFANGYVWMDYISIPQDDRTNQGLAIASITSYVALADLFLVLAGPWQHADDGSIRDVRAWGERGWCRMESLANALSPRSKTLVVAQSPTDIVSFGPLGIVGRMWFQETVGRGRFTVEADKLALGPTIQRLLTRRIAQAERERDWPLFRFLHAISRRLLYGTGVEQPNEPLGDWLARLRFCSIHDGVASGLTPLRYAVIAERADLVEQLLEQGVDIESPCARKVAGEWVFPGDTILHSASMFTGSEDACIIQMLLSRGANTRAVQRNPPCGHALLNAAVCSNIPAVDALHKADPSLWQVPHFGGILPFEEALMVGRPEMTAHVFEHYPEQLRGLPEGVDTFLNMDGKRGVQPARTRAYMERTKGAPLVWYAVNHIGDPRVLKIVLGHGNDPNGGPINELRLARLPWRLLVGIGTFFSERMSAPPDLFDRFANFYTLPLHIAALTGNLGCVRMLLDHGADPTLGDSRRGMTPLHLAAMKGHESCAKLLLQHAPEGVGVASLAALKDRKGRTAARWAMKRGHCELALNLKRIASGSAQSLWTEVEAPPKDHLPSTDASTVVAGAKYASLHTQASAANSLPLAAPDDEEEEEGAGDVENVVME